jgi:hypothetical protein
VVQPHRPHPLSFSGKGHVPDSVEEMEEDVGLDSSSHYSDAELPMDSPERKAAIEEQIKPRHDDE